MDSGDDAALADFVLARIAADERTARFVASDSPTSLDGQAVFYGQRGDDPDRLVLAVDYQRILADCRSKRRIVGHVPPADGQARGWYRFGLLMLAQPYSDHEEFRDEWRSPEA